MEEDDLQSLAPVLGRVPSGLFILTARQGEAETGMLVSWVQQCSFDPPQVTLAIRRERDVLAWLQPGAAFTLNLLSEGQTGLISHFGKGFALGEPAFAGLDVERREGQAPILKSTLGYLLCQVAARHDVADHELLIARVTGGQMLQPDGRPYVHVRKSGLRY